MKLFGKKKPAVQEVSYEIFGGATVRKTEGSYEIAWKGSHPMSVKFSFPPEIEEGVKTERRQDMIRITSQQCRLRIVTKDGDMKAFISELKFLSP